MTAPIVPDRFATCQPLRREKLRRTFPTEKAVDLTGARVAVLGCGSVGGLAAWCLAGAGVTALELADRDWLEPSNLRRHVCGRSDLGRPKAEAVASFLRDRYDALTPVPQDFCFLKQPERLRDLLHRCAIALVAVDDEAPKHLIDVMARELSRPVVYTGVYGGGWAAEAIVTDPAADTPCYACTARTLGRVGVATSLPAPGPAYALPNPTVALSEWVQADLTSILPAAALASRLVVAWLTQRRGLDRPWRAFVGVGINAWRLALRRVPAWEFGPWELRPIPARRQPDCPVCGGRTASPDTFDSLLAGGPQ